MELRQLEYFIEVARCQNFTRAAEHLLVAQPAISKSIQKLEQELGLQLIDRANKHVSLTPEGDVFLRHALAILDKVQEAKLEMDEMRGLEKGEIRIGLPSMVGSYFFPHVIKEFKRKYQSLQISVVEEGTMQIQKLIERKEVDLGIIALENPSAEIDFYPLFKEEMIVCVPRSHPLATRQSISYQDLIHEPLILFKEGYFQRQLILEMSKITGITPNVTFSSNQLSLIKSLVTEGLGITLFLRKVVESDPNLVPLSLEPPVFLHMAIAWNRSSYLSKAGVAFLDFIKNNE
jgi:DNA-binding transcriptional LysR family regulator